MIQYWCLRPLGCLLALLLLTDLVSTGRVPRGYYQGTRDRPRAIRGFKNPHLSTARGFGKRSSSATQSLPGEWLVGELSKNPSLARLIIYKFIDSNQDGIITEEELLRPLTDSFGPQPVDPLGSERSYSNPSYGLLTDPFK